MGLNMDMVNPKEMLVVNDNCCLSNSIVCEGNSVKRIQWNSYALNGTLNSSAIPLSIKVLRMHTNKIMGELPKVDHLNQLTDLDLYSNLLNGSFTGFPPRAIDVKIHGNKLSGSIPAFPNSLVLFYALNNKFTGSIPNNMPNNLHLRNNMLTGSIPVLPLGMQTLRVSENFLSGNISAIPRSMSILSINLDVYSSNRISGSLAFNAPEEIRIFNNKFTSITVEDTSKLTVCILSHNPIQTNLTGKLRMCTKDAIGTNYTELLSNSSSSVSLYEEDFLYSLSEDYSYPTSEEPYYSTTALDVVHESTSAVKIVTLIKRIRSTSTTQLAVASSTKHMPTLGMSTIKPMTTTLLKDDRTSLFIYKVIDDVNHFEIRLDPFKIIKLIVNVLLLTYLIFKLMKRTKNKRRSQISNKSEM